VDSRSLVPFSVYKAVSFPLRLIAIYLKVSTQKIWLAVPYLPPYPYATISPSSNPSSTPMAPTKRVTIAPTGLTPAAEEGVNLLWTFQLRKENAGLLEKLEASERTIQTCRMESSRHFQDVNERVAALEARLHKIESEEKKDRLAIENWGAAVRNLKRKIDDGIEKLSSASEVSSTPSFGHN
jgi:hypothetical protein